MRKVFAVSLIGFATLGSGTQKASAWWLDTLFYQHRCCANICCRQYNAFSPFCCQGAVGQPLPGHGNGGSPACSFTGDQGYPGELPAPGTIAGPVLNAPAAPPGDGGPASRSSVTVPGENIHLPGLLPRPLPNWGAGMMNPVAPGYYPGFPGYGPVNGNNSPSYYPGFPGYGPANGFGR